MHRPVVRSVGQSQTILDEIFYVFVFLVLSWKHKEPVSLTLLADARTDCLVVGWVGYGKGYLQV